MGRLAPQGEEDATAGGSGAGGRSSEGGRRLVVPAGDAGRGGDGEYGAGSHDEEGGWKAGAAGGNASAGSGGRSGGHRQAKKLQDVLELPSEQEVLFGLHSVVDE